MTMPIDFSKAAAARKRGDPRTLLLELEEPVGNIRDHCTILDALIERLIREGESDGDGGRMFRLHNEDVDALAYASILVKLASRRLHDEYYAAVSS